MATYRTLEDLVKQFGEYLSPSRVPESSVPAYKLFRQKDDQLYPLFVNANQPTPQGVLPHEEAVEIARSKGLKDLPRRRPDGTMYGGAAGAAAAGLLGFGASEDAEAAPFGTLARRLGYGTQEAWHGSPFMFEDDRLLGSMKGRGEGNAAYADGRYVSLSQGVGQEYKDSLAGFANELQFPDRVERLPNANDYYAARYGDNSPAWQEFEQKVGTRGAGKAVLDSTIRAAATEETPLEALEYVLQSKKVDPQDAELARRYLSGATGAREFESGALYGVEIPETQRLLDWDIPLASQPEEIKQPLSQVWSDLYLASATGQDLSAIARMDPVQRRLAKERLQVPPLPEGTTGEQLYLQLAEQLGGKGQASDYLNSKGIPGTTYIGVESQERNAVLFNDDATNVFSKDGQPFGKAELPVPEVEELDMGAFRDMFSGRAPQVAAGAGAAGLLASQGASAEALQADAQRRAAEAYDPVAALRAQPTYQQPATDGLTQTLQGSAEQIAGQELAANRKRAQERAGGLVEAGTGLLGDIGQAIPKNIRENPVASLAGEFTGLPGLYRAGEEYLSGVERISPEAAVDVASAAVPFLPVARGLRAADRAVTAADDARRASVAGTSLRPGTEGYRGATASLDQARRVDEPRVEIPRLRSANKGRPKGTIVGLPKGLEPTEANVERLADEYAGRVMKGIENGVQPGYFYKEGSQNVRDWTGNDPYETARVSAQLAATSPQASVPTNLLWQVKGREQQAMGYPVRSGKSPGQVRKDYQKVEESLARQRALGVENPEVEVGGAKTNPFGRYMNNEKALAPNDRWEMFGIGYPRDATFTPQERQMAHYIRQRAQERLRERGVNLDLDQIQEIHWQAVRGPETGTPMVPGAGDTFQHSADPLTVQHNWEIAPGTHAQHMPEYYANPEIQPEINERLRSKLVDENGRDRLVAATGGTMQPRPSVGTRTQFDGYQTQGYKSYSMSPVDKGRAPGKGGMEKATRERLQGTEATRAFTLGQTAGSASVRRGGQSSEMANEVQFGLTEPLNPDEFGNLQGAIDRVFGPDKVFAEMTPQGIALTHWEDPLRLRVAEGEFAEFGKNVKYKKAGKDYPAGAVQITPKSKAATKRLIDKYGKDNVSVNAKTGVVTLKGQREDWDRALASGGYSEIVDALGSKYNREGINRTMRDDALVTLPWEEGRATETVLAQLTAPGQRELYDSAEVRGIMGDIAGEYRAIEASGKATPNPKLVAVLEAWAKGGLAAVEDMVKKGLAPAAALATAISIYNQQGAAKAPGDAI